MLPRTFKPFTALVGSSTILLSGLLLSRGAIAQTLPVCQPPNTGEYLLLVLNETDQTPAQLQQTLPPNASTTVCNYLGREVTRVGGFDDPNVASSWAQYLTDIGGLQAFVARPSEGGPATPAPLPTAPGSPVPDAATPVVLPPAAISPDAPPAPIAALPPASGPSPVTPQPETADPPLSMPAPVATGPIPPERYNPQPLGEGYAVLVDYGNRPEVAAQIQQLLGRPIGLASFEQRPFLLAVYTSDPAVASQVLQTLSDRNFTAAIVDSRQAILLTPAIVLGP
jgi:hypothetical protein